MQHSQPSRFQKESRRLPAITQVRVDVWTRAEITALLWWGVVTVGTLSLFMTGRGIDLSREAMTNQGNHGMPNCFAIDQKNNYIHNTGGQIIILA